jgi:hypothetical protein
MADRHGRAPSTISRELRRNAPAGRGYQPFDAHRRAAARCARHHPRRGDTNDRLSGVVTELLGNRWNPPADQSPHAPALSLVNRRCGRATKVSIKQTNRIRASRGPRGERRTDVHRCAPVAIIAGRASTGSVGGHGFSNRCRSSATGPSQRSTGRKPRIGKEFSPSAAMTAPRSALWWNARPESESARGNQTGASSGRRGRTQRPFPVCGCGHLA